MILTHNIKTQSWALAYWKVKSQAIETFNLCVFRTIVLIIKKKTQTLGLIISTITMQQFIENFEQILIMCQKHFQIGLKT